MARLQLLCGKVEQFGPWPAERVAGAGEAGARTIIRRRPEDGVLHQVLRAHLETFLAEGRQRSGGNGLPAFVERELREFLTCGVMARGFARFRCSGCGYEILVAYSCKGRGFCHSCCGRRMVDVAAHLTDEVFGDLPVRQWVLTLPYRLRYVLAWNHELCRKVLGVFTRALLSFEQRRAGRRGAQVGQGGAVTAIQRFGSSANLNVHFHTLALQGVFVEVDCGGVRFVASTPPTDVEVAELVVRVSERVRRLVSRHGIELERPSDEVEGMDPLANESPLLAGLCGASVVGRVATGRRAGQRVLRVGAEENPTLVLSSGRRQAHVDGFDLQANVGVQAGDRDALKRLTRYVLRPPVAQDALELTTDGRILLHLKCPWSDGTRAILFEPSELIEKLAALVPRPRIHLLLYHGVFGPAARHRREAVAVAKRKPRPVVKCRVGPRPHRSWAELLKRAFAIDILSCPECRGRLHLLATLEQPETLRRILTHLGLPAKVPETEPARAPPEQQSFDSDLWGA